MPSKKADLQDLTMKLYESQIGVPAGEGELKIAKVSYSERNGVEVIDENGDLYSVWIQKTRQHIELKPVEPIPASTKAKARKRAE